MAAPRFLGIDVGLTGVRAAVLDAGGKVLAAARHPAETDALAPQALAEGALAAGAEAVARLPEGPGGVAALAVCAFGPAPVLLSAAGAAILRLPLRPGAPQAGGIDSAEDGAGDDLALRVAAARRTHPGAFAAARLVCDTAGFLTGVLTGRPAIDPATAEDLAAAGLGPLPDPLPPAAVAGGLLPGPARRLGLPAGLPVAAGGYDSTGDLIALGFGPERPAALVLGSTLVLGRLSATPPADPGLRSSALAPGLTLAGGWTSAAGSLIDRAADWLQGAPAEAAGEGPAPLVLPHLAGERAPLWDASATGAILGLTLATDRAALWRGVIEGVALSALDIAERLEPELGPAPAWWATGGGARSAVLVQALADALGAPVRPVAGAGAAPGPAVLAARAAGCDLTLADEAPVAPRPGAALRMRRRLPLYRRAQAALSGLHRALRAENAVDDVEEGDRTR